MKIFAAIHFISSESVDFYEGAFLETVNNISGPDNFYTQVMFSDSLFDENLSMKKVNLSEPKSGLVSMFSDSDFFTVDEVKNVYYKSSSIHSINFC